MVTQTYKSLCKKPFESEVSCEKPLCGGQGQKDQAQAQEGRLQRLLRPLPREQDDRQRRTQAGRPTAADPEVARRVQHSGLTSRIGGTVGRGVAVRVRSVDLLYESLP